MKQTAVEWLYNHLFPNQLDGFSEEEWDKIDKAFEQAKEMEKQQIIDAYMIGDGDAYHLDQVKQEAEQYYNETYKEIYTEDISPDWKGDPHHPNRWDGW